MNYEVETCYLEVICDADFDYGIKTSVKWQN